MTAETVQPADLAAPAPRRPLSPRMARLMASTERVLYATGGVAATVGPHTGPWQLHLGAVAVGAGTLAHLWRRTRAGGSGLLVACYRALPILGLSGCYTAALTAPGTAWWEVAAPIAVAGLSALAVPVTRSLGVARAVEELPDVVAAHGDVLEAETVADEEHPRGYVAGLQQMWEASSATGETRLVDVVQDAPDRPDFTAVILAPAGEAVPRHLDEHTVAAVFDVPKEAVTLTPVRGAGPGRLALRVAPAAADEEASRFEDDQVRALWETRVSGPTGAAPGMQLADYRLTDDRLVVLVQADEDRMISLPRNRIARALRVEDPDLVMIETDGLAHGVVTVYREHPLINIREATAEDLTMGKDGRITIGLRHDGRPARWPLYDPELGALTDLLVGAPGSGKSVTLLTLLAAERLSGVVSIVADAQDGMSLPEAQDRVFHFGAGRAALGATLAAFCAVADYRERVSASLGWGSFTLGDPWPLAIITLDEINRVLSSGNDMHEDFRTWCTGMISRIQLTGRKLGMGIRFAGQSIHLADLGDSDKIRAGARQGTVWLGRVNGSMTQRMATDMTNGATEVAPIPRHFGAGGSSQVAAAWTGEESATGPVTAGCAWLIQGGHPSMTRTFRAVKERRTYPGLISLMERAPIPSLTPEEEEVFREAYTEALPYAEALMTGGKKAAAAAGAEAAPAAPVLTKSPAIPAPAARPLRDLVLEALADGPLRTRDIRAAVGVGTDGGPSAGTVGNLLTALREEGVIVAAGHGRWALPGHPTE